MSNTKLQKYFGTDGIRGRVGTYPITPDFALRLAYITGRVLSKHLLSKESNSKLAVIIGKDTRLSGYLFESSLEAGFCYSGIDVYMAGVLPTPAISYLTKSLNLLAGVVISASHNPYTDNGIKFFDNSGNKLDDVIEAEIEACMHDELIASDVLGRVYRLDEGINNYINFCKNTFSKLKNPTHNYSLNNLKIVLDCANGATYNVAPAVFTQLGAKVIAIADKPNGININLECGSTHPEHLKNAVFEHKADLGIAFDGDGDRVLIVDNLGNIYNGDKLLYIILKGYLALGHKIQGVVGTVMTNLALEKQLLIENIELIRTKVGDRYILQELNRRQWYLGGEQSGHLLCLDKHTTGDGIISALQVLLSMSILKKSLVEIISWSDYPQILINVSLTSDKMAYYNSPKVQKKINSIISQIMLSLDNNIRIVVRQSGTESVVRVMVEAVTHSIAKKYANELVEYITQL